MTEPEIKKASIVAVTVFIVCALICSIISIFYPFTDTTDTFQKAIIGFGFGLYIGIPAAVAAFYAIYASYIAREKRNARDQKEFKSNVNLGIILFFVVIIFGVIVFILSN